MPAPIILLSTISLNLATLSRLFLLGLSLALFSSVIHAQITQVQLLTFGKIVVLDNSVQYSLRVEPDGRVRRNAAFVLIEDPKPAIFHFSQLPANTSFSIQVDEENDGVTLFSEVGQPTALFTIQPFFSFSSYRTNQHGEAEVPMGGILTTSGDGKLYHDGTYYRSFNIFVNF